MERLGQPTGVGVSKAICQWCNQGNAEVVYGWVPMANGGAGHKMKLMLAKDLNLYNNTNNHTELVTMLRPCLKTDMVEHT